MYKYYIDKELIEENAKSALTDWGTYDPIKAIRIFPDIHFCAEKSLPVGVAFESEGEFFPLVTGKDMGCGVAYLRIPISDYREFNKDKHFRALDRDHYKMTDEGLGGGNHFLSLEKSDKYLYIIVHTGSRNLGIYMYQKNLGLIRDFGDSQRGSLPIQIANDEYINEYNRIINYAASRRKEFLLKTFDFLLRNKYVNRVDYEISDSVHNHLEFLGNRVIHRKGSTALSGEVAIPLSMTRGSLIVKANEWHPEYSNSLMSCSHGAGRKLSRTDTLKYWHSLKKSDKEDYKKSFPELLERNGEFPSGIIQEMDFAYKATDSILESQPHLIKVDSTKPILTIKFTEI